ncbi:MAG: hypothetical protein HC934_01255 [Acaryochloridaceae cyanobacterium SU_2_1]|nr:hypothetical protein [Acaryochloridaceae cyanobacterium SU_2_1]
MNVPDHTNRLRQFRAEINSSFKHPQDSCMDLLTVPHVQRHGHLQWLN